ncbi:SPOR domain-containing protein [Thermocrinis sp.]
MKKERLVILLGTLVALISFYLGLNQWLKQKTPTEPPPVVVRPIPKPVEGNQSKVEKLEPPVEQKPETEKEKEDLIAKKIEEEKKKDSIKQIETEKEPKQVAKNSLTAQKDRVKKEKKEYVIQIGAFVYKENAEKALSKAKGMGYAGEIVSEDKFYKVRVKVRTDNIKTEVNKLKSVFGSAIVKR